ncbi:MAG: pyruvate phosphate dikinase PEP/pyruvate-binding protein [Bacillota bacterium]|jgi:pyruvate,water dikinase|nr:pyruvate phosphate dikinase PEP/pyruvate-binding protein [Bacillota bacterium]
MSNLILDFQEIDKTQITAAGGKGANLGELSRMEGIHVPEGFCITTEAYHRVLRETTSAGELLEQLASLKQGDWEQIGALSAKIRIAIEDAGIPEDIQEEILRTLSRFGPNHAYAVRSSATAEDLPTASFAGQQDTYLNLVGIESILKHISKCWASLFTERAVTYRIQNCFDHRTVQLAVIVQKMVCPESSGILFTVDPVTSNRTIVSIDAGFGLGEAMVSGIVSADLYQVRDGNVIEKKISSKKRAISAMEKGGTKEYDLEPELQNQQVLTEPQILELANLGRRIEAYFGCPQDIEWCLADGTFSILQSRPITTLYPIPEANDQEKHVYVSVGHQQMMTDPLRPLGMSVFEMTSFGTRFRAGGRLFVDVAPMLAASESRGALLQAMGQHDPLIKDALITLIDRGDFIKPLADTESKPGNKATAERKTGNMGTSGVFQSQLESDPEIVSVLIRRSRESIEMLSRTIREKSGTALFDFIRDDIQKLKNALFEPQSMDVIMAASNAASWINEKMKEWLGEKNAADVLSQSVPNNITSEMGLGLLDLADTLRPYPEVIQYLQHGNRDLFYDELLKYKGGYEVREAICNYLDQYGMRCAGEIDITRTRWSEKPELLLSMMLNNLKNFTSGESKRRFERGLREALEKEKELIDRLKLLPGGYQKVEETKRAIDLLRTFTGYREYPKFEIVQRYFIYKKALLKEAERLLELGVITEIEDIYYLTFEEFGEAVRTEKLDRSVIPQRKEEFKHFERLTPPRVMTSDGEIITGSYHQKDLPAGAIPGLAVSSGVAEGRARVILKMEDANLEADDILVTSFTDPSWTPLFVNVKALITEVGGLMTHGAVIAREYGLPAVVGVEDAVKLIRDGQRIRVNGTEGYVMVISDDK